MRSIQRLPALLFVAAIPVLLVTISVTYAFNEPRLYEYGFDKYEVSRVTGISEEELKESGRQIRSYFNSTTEPLLVTARVNGVERELFTPREVSHMRDVKRLVWGVYGLGAGALLFLGSYAALGLLRRRGGFGLALARRLMWGSGATVALVVGVGVFSLLGFDRLFLWFHQVSFSNDFWQLDPRRDFLVMMFPQGFWLDATLFVGILALGQSVVLGGVSAGWLWWRRRATRQPTPVLPQPSPAAND